MYEYRVDTYMMKINTSFNKQNRDLESYLNEMSGFGWELVSITSIPYDNTNYTYELIFRKEKKL